MWLNKLNILFIIILAGTLRLFSLNQSLWWDEAINVVYAKQYDLWWFVSKYPLGDFHPPGWFFILWIWGHLFGWSEISVRMPSVILGIGTVYFTYLIGEKLFSKKIGLLAALMLSLAPLHIYYSQEARMYAFSAFAVSFSIYCLIRLIEKGKNSFLIFAFSAALVLYSDYVAYFIFPIQIIYLYFFEKRIIKTYLFSLGVALITFLPWLIVFPQQIMSGTKTAIAVPGWKNIVGSSSLKELMLLPVKILIGRISIDNNFIYSILIVVIAAPFLSVFTKIKKGFDNKNYLIILWLFLAPVLVWLFSFFLPILSYFRLLYILPAFYILTAIYLTKFSDSYFKIFLVLILFFELTASSFYLFDQNYQREDWKDAVRFVDNRKTDKSLVMFKNNEISAPYRYYSDNLKFAVPAFKTIPAKTEQDISDFDITGKSEIYLFNYLTEVTDPQNLLEKKLLSMNFKKVSVYNFRGVGFITLYKK